MDELKCTECGASALEDVGDNRLRCHYCRALYERHVEAAATVHIRGGANVVFGSNAHVVVRGGLQVDKGANVRVDGHLTLLERGVQKA